MGSRPGWASFPQSPKGLLTRALSGYFLMNVFAVMLGISVQVPCIRRGQDCHLCVYNLGPGTVSCCAWLILKGQRFRIGLHTVHEEASEILAWKGKLRVPFCFSRRDARRGTGSETQTHGGAQRGAQASAAKQGSSAA